MELNQQSRIYFSKSLYTLLRSSSDIKQEQSRFTYFLTIRSRRITFQNFFFVTSQYDIMIHDQCITDLQHYHSITPIPFLPKHIPALRNLLALQNVASPVAIIAYHIATQSTVLFYHKSTLSITSPTLSEGNSINNQS